MSVDGLQEKIIIVRRTATVVKGGRIFSFNALVVVGNGKGQIGLGDGSSQEVSIAVQKARENACRNMVFIELNNNTLYHNVTVSYGATKVFMKPALEGTGIIAGGPMRAVFEVLGVKNVLAKVISPSSNPINVVKATVKALKNMFSPHYIAQKRGKTLNQIFGTVKKEQLQESN